MTEAEKILRQVIQDLLPTVDLSKAQQLAELRYKEALTPREVEALFGIEARQLQDWRSNGIGPRYVKAADRTILYRADAVREFLSLKTVRTYDAA